jgi:hypothetical protein
LAESAEESLLEVRTAVGDVSLFSLAALDALPQHSFTTATTWTDGVLSFSGPPLAVVLNAAGLPQETVLGTAANEYSANLTFPPCDDLVPIIATRIEGNLIPRRAKGPLWIVFPYDEDPRFRTPTVYGQSVWQLVSLSAVPSDLM